MATSPENATIVATFPTGDDGDDENTGFSSVGRIATPGPAAETAKMVSFAGLLAMPNFAGTLDSIAMRGISSWLERMYDSRDPGPATRIAVRQARQKVDIAVVSMTDDFDEIAIRLVQVCRDHAGASRRSSYLFRAVDDGGTPVGAMRHTPRRTRTLRGKALASRATSKVERSIVESATEIRSSYEHFALASMLELQKTQERTIARLEAQNRELRRENSALQIRIQRHRGSRDAVRPVEPRPEKSGG
jgi:hypothetical protein